MPMPQGLRAIGPGARATGMERHQTARPHGVDDHLARHVPVDRDVSHDRPRSGVVDGVAHEPGD
jgi:hypothetical protein